MPDKSSFDSIIGVSAKLVLLFLFLRRWTKRKRRATEKMLTWSASWMAAKTKKFANLLSHIMLVSNDNEIMGYFDTFCLSVCQSTNLLFVSLPIVSLPLF
jgi:hypothetical protein